MTKEKTNLTITRNEDGQISIQGDEAIVKKISIVIGEYLLTDGEMTEKKLDTLVDIAEDLYNCGNCSPEHLTAAKKFLEAIEKYSYPRAMNVLAWIQKNPLISEAMEMRAAAVGDPPTVENFLEEYTAQAAYWQKKIAEAEGKTFDGNAPTDKEISDSKRLRFFNVYKRAFDGNLDDMKTCLEFCREEIALWSNR